MGDDIIVVVPGKPQSWERVVWNPEKKRAFVPPATKQKKKHIADCARVSMMGRDPIDGACMLHVTFFMSIAKSWTKAKKAAARSNRLHPTPRPDLDNLIKCVMDGMDGIVTTDDARVTRIVAEKRYSENPRTEIMVRAL